MSRNAELTSNELDQVSAVNSGEDGVEEESHSSGIQQSGKRYSSDSVQRGEDPSELRGEEGKRVGQSTRLHSCPGSVQHRPEAGKSSNEAN